jgi:hypothetical protein
VAQVSPLNLTECSLFKPDISHIKESILILARMIADGSTQEEVNRFLDCIPPDYRSEILQLAKESALTMT